MCYEPEPEPDPEPATWLDWLLLVFVVGIILAAVGLGLAYVAGAF